MLANEEEEIMNVDAWHWTYLEKHLSAGNDIVCYLLDIIVAT